MKYRTIVADPPWDIEGTGVRFGRGDSRYANWTEGEDAGPVALPFSTLSTDEVCALPVKDLAADDAHLYLWTIQRFLVDSFEVVSSWGFRVSATLVWCKEPHGFNPGGTFGSTVEFCHFARRGSLKAKTTIPTRWFSWPRQIPPPVARGASRQSQHSRKPEAFLDMVEQVSPGPYLELFARRNRLGWDTWGNEALPLVEMPS